MRTDPWAGLRMSLVWKSKPLRHQRSLPCAALCECGHILDCVQWNDVKFDTWLWNLTFDVKFEIRCHNPLYKVNLPNVGQYLIWSFCCLTWLHQNFETSHYSRR
jgi:hypothetical protein